MDRGKALKNVVKYINWHARIHTGLIRVSMRTMLSADEEPQIGCFTAPSY